MPFTMVLRSSVYLRRIPHSVLKFSGRPSIFYETGAPIRRYVSSMKTIQFLWLLACCGTLRADEHHTVLRSITVGGRERTYRVHVPSAPQKPFPVVLAFHGGGSDGKEMEKLSDFDALSDAEGFLAVYPEAFERNWNDGRGATRLRSHREDVDDVAFVSALLDALAKEYEIDEKRIFATGISNGAIFSHTLAARLADRIAAIAPVVGGMASKIGEEFQPKRPVAVLVIQSTDDPLVPIAGGKIRGLGGREAGDHGEILGTPEVLKKWASVNGCGDPGTEEGFPDRAPRDGCRAKRQVWSGRATISLITVEGGGHTWPGGRQYLPERLIGRVCRDFDATAAIWDFFKANGR